MTKPKNRFFPSLFVALLCVGFGIWGCAASHAPETESSAINTAAESEQEKIIPIYGAITHVHSPDNRVSTVIDIVIGDDFKGTLPDDIDTITVTGPGGKLTLGKSEFNYYSQFRDFWISIPSVAEIGTYTFTVTRGVKFHEKKE